MVVAIHALRWCNRCAPNYCCAMSTVLLAFHDDCHMCCMQHLDFSLGTAAYTRALSWSRGCRFVRVRVLLLLPHCTVRIHFLHASQSVLWIYGNGLLCTLPDPCIGWVHLLNGVRTLDIQKHQERLMSVYHGLCLSWPFSSLEPIGRMIGHSCLSVRSVHDRSLNVG